MRSPPVAFSAGRSKTCRVAPSQILHFIGGRTIARTGSRRKPLHGDGAAAENPARLPSIKRVQGGNHARPLQATGNLGAGDGVVGGGPVRGGAVGRAGG